MISRMRERKRKTRNTWRGLMIALLLGFVTSIVVAQLIALFGSIDRLTIPDQPPEYGANHVPRYIDDIAPAFMTARWEAPVENPKGSLYNYLEIGTDIVEYSFGEEFAVWAKGTHGDTPPRASIIRCFVGLPFRCMYYDEFTVANGGGQALTTDYFHRVRSRAGIRVGLPSPGPASFWNGRRIPLAPMWGGLVGNTLIFGMLIYFFVAISRGIRCRVRQKRGLCLACGYAVENLERCPECGSLADAVPDFVDALPVTDSSGDEVEQG
jgi:hypothetical protein